MAVAVHNGLVEHFNNLISAPDALGEEIEIFVNICLLQEDQRLDMGFQTTSMNSEASAQVT